MEKHLGKLRDVCYGFGGYQDAQFGLSVTLDMNGSVVADFRGFWSRERSESAKWKDSDRTDCFAETACYIIQLLTDAGVQDISELTGVPVEVTLDGQKLDSWRVLTEVL